MTAPRPSHVLPPPRLVVATHNAGKLAEMRRLLSQYQWRVLSLDDVGFHDEIEEPGPTYADNAGAKAAAVLRATGLPALADDSGLEVEAMRGWPGVHSARWLPPPASDTDRLRGLIAEVERATPGDRRVKYVCVCVLARPDATPVAAHGECLGVLTEPRGSGGFGYDPAFLSNDLGITFGEATQEAKDRVSHRARAMARLGESGVLDPPQSFL